MISVSVTGRPSKRSTASRFGSPRADVLDQRGDRRTQPFLVRLAQRHERPAAALDEERGLAAEQHDLRPGHAGGARAGSLRPRQRRAVGLRRIGGGEHERLRVVLGPELAQPLDRSGKRELGAAESFDEVAAPAGADRLEILQLGVDGAVAAGDPLAADAVARDDSLALEQQLGERAPVRRSGEQPVGRRPAPLGRRDRGAAGAREAARPTRGARSLVAATGPQRRPGVVRHLARPDELPERRQRGLRLEAGCPRAGRARTSPTCPSASRIASASGVSGRGAPAGGPSTDASSRK